MKLYFKLYNKPFWNSSQYSNASKQVAERKAQATGDMHSWVEWTHDDDEMVLRLKGWGQTSSRAEAAADDSDACAFLGLQVSNVPQSL